MSELTPDNFPESASITNEVDNEFDVGDITQELLNQNHVLRLALQAEIRHCWVEFLFTNPVKPHLVFKFNFRQEFVVGKRTFISCRLSMDLHTDEDGEQGPGGCLLKIVSYAGRTAVAKAGFQFRVNGRWMLQEAVSIVLGRHPRLPVNMRSDLTDYHFVLFEATGGQDLFDGCRDWVSRAFVRFHCLGLVEWDIEGIVAPEPAETLSPDQEIQLHDTTRERFQPVPGCPPINWHTAGFHDIISKVFHEAAENGQFRDHQNRLYDAPIIRYRRLDVEEGMFRPSIRRFYHAQKGPAHPLPYRTQQGQQPHGGPGGPDGPGGPEGGNGGRGGGAGYRGSSGAGAAGGHGGSGARGGSVLREEVLLTGEALLMEEEPPPLGPLVVMEVPVLVEGVWLLEEVLLKGEAPLMEEEPLTGVLTTSLAPNPLVLNPLVPTPPAPNPLVLNPPGGSDGHRAESSKTNPGAKTGSNTESKAGVNPGLNARSGEKTNGTSGAKHGSSVSGVSGVGSKPSSNSGSKPKGGHSSKLAGSK